MRASPLSTTSRTPSMVSDVSATLVATTTLRFSPRASAASCSLGGSSAWGRNPGDSPAESRPRGVDGAGDLVRPRHENERIALMLLANETLKPGDGEIPYRR